MNDAPRLAILLHRQDSFSALTSSKMAGLRVNASQPSPTGLRNSMGSESQLDSVEPTAKPMCDIFNTTFSLHRASPLFFGLDGLSGTRLRALEQRLRDMLVGDVVRGVEVGLDAGDDYAMGNAGVLEAITIEWVAAHDAVATSRPALQVTLQYENALCLALLLPLPEAPETRITGAVNPSDTFLHLPLLLLRMPIPLKAIIVSFLSSTFDCRIGPLHLSGKDIIHSWETWAHGTSLPTRGPLTRDVVLTLVFSLPGPGQVVDTIDDEATNGSTVFSGAADAAVSDSTTLGLKSVDIFVPNDDLRGFLKAGQKSCLEDNDISSTPFTGALAYYVKHHLALDMANPAVGIVRVACGGFVLSESRLKIFNAPDFSSDNYSNRHHNTIPRLLGGLVERARR